MFQYPAKKGPYRIALANGYIANTWRIQMIKTAKAYAAQPEVAAKLKEFKVVSTGEDVAAQIAAINNFIDSGYDAIVVNAQNPAAFKPVIKRANDAGVVLVAFDNILDTEEAINVNVDQKGLGKYWAEWLVKNVRTAARCSKYGRVRHLGRSRPARGHPGSVQGVGQEVGHGRSHRQVGRSDGAEGHGRRDRRAQEVRRDHRARRRYRRRAGDDRRQASVRAFGGETENGFRKFCGKYGGRG
jgi:ribose transport system substrate-binding protein